MVCTWWFSIVARGGSRVAATTKMERFMIIFNDIQPLTIVTKHSILDVVAALDPPLVAIPLLMANDLTNFTLRKDFAFAQNSGQVVRFVIKILKDSFLTLCCMCFKRCSVKYPSYQFLFKYIVFI